ncbi:MAG: DUF5320 domain-containing protein [bacterium]
MPGRDGKGPLGQGSMTGRGFGNCLAYGIPLIAGTIAAFRFGKGKGFGRGFGWRNIANITGASSANDELSALKNQANILEDNLKEVKERISKLEQE